MTELTKRANKRKVKRDKSATHGLGKNVSGIGWDFLEGGEGYVPINHANRVDGGLGDGCRRVPAKRNQQ